MGIVTRVNFFRDEVHIDKKKEFLNSQKKIIEDSGHQVIDNYELTDQKYIDLLEEYKERINETGTNKSILKRLSVKQIPVNIYDISRYLVIAELLDKNPTSTVSYIDSDIIIKGNVELVDTVAFSMGIRVKMTGVPESRKVDIGLMTHTYDSIKKIVRFLSELLSDNPSLLVDEFMNSNPFKTNDWGIYGHHMIKFMLDSKYLECDHFYDIVLASKFFKSKGISNAELFKKISDKNYFNIGFDSIHKVRDV